MTDPDLRAALERLIVQMGKIQRYDMVTNFRCGQSVDELERADDGEWLRWEDVEAVLALVPASQEQERQGDFQRIELWCHVCGYHFSGHTSVPVKCPNDSTPLKNHPVVTGVRAPQPDRPYLCCNETNEHRHGFGPGIKK